MVQSTSEITSSGASSLSPYSSYNKNLSMYILIALILRRRRKLRMQHRRVGAMRPVEVKVEHFNQIYNVLRQDETKFKKYFSLSISAFDNLLNILKKDISGTNTNMKQCIPATERLGITLRYLYSGCSLTDMRNTFGLSGSAMSKIIQRVCKSIWRIMKDKCIPLPTHEQWIESAKRFEQKSNFPCCVGAILSKHIRIRRPSDDETAKFGKKNAGSLQLIGICDTNYRLLYVDVKRTNDFTDFKNCEDQLNIPESEINNKKLPYVIVGSKGFALSKILMRPYLGKCLPDKKAIFNARLARAERNAQCTFALISNKWKIFRRPIDVSCEFAEDMIRACFVLHNYILDNDGFIFEETLVMEGLYDLADDSSRGGRKCGNAVRDMIASYFMSEEDLTPKNLTKI